jgi:multiple sugar transport system substrate-binding protein
VLSRLREFLTRPLREPLGRDGLILVAVLGLVAALLASTINHELARPDALEEGPIVILSGRDDSLGGQRQALVSQWNKLHEHSQARIVELPALADAQRSEMLARAQSSGSGVDIYNLDVTWTAEFADAGYIQSLDESTVPTDAFLPKPLATCRYDGRLWALPFNTDVGLLYYRTDVMKDVLGREDPPRTWAQLENDVVHVREKTADGIWGYVGQFANYEGLTVTGLELIWGAGGTVVDEDGSVVADKNKVAIEAGLERLRAIAPPDVPELDEAGSLQAFRSGQALFMRNWPVAYRSLAAGAQGNEDTPTVPFDVAPLPGGPGALGGQNLAVSAGTDQPRAARALIDFLTSDRSQQVLFERGGLPATREVVYSDPVLEDDKRYPYLKKLHDALGSAELRPAVPNYARFSEVFRSSVDGYLRRRSTQLPDNFGSQLEAALKGRSIPP